MKTPRIAIVGTGGMGSSHLGVLASTDAAELVAVCDSSPEVARRKAAEYDVPYFTDAETLLDAGVADGIVIATPHYDHTVIAEQAFRREDPIHVLSEKPVGVHVNDVRRTIDAYNNARAHRPDLVYAAMFQRRTFGEWRKIREIIVSGELGRIVRATWIKTDWFRTQAYYDSGGWRGTWAGEGGGVLMNQCPHDLDLLQWLFGMPDSISGFATIGKFHHIEVEDEVTALLRYENGLTVHFITTTAEYPGTNRLEVVGERGKLVYENASIRFHRNRESMLVVSNTTSQRFTSIENWDCAIPFEPGDDTAGRRAIIENFCRAISSGEEVIGPASEGLNSVMIANAVMLSEFEGHRSVEVPIDGDRYESLLKERIRSSRFTKNAVVAPPSDERFEQSH
jgi:predicted dehydrogenase